MSYELISLRSLVGASLNKAFEKHPNIFVIDSDLASSTTTDVFRDAHPSHFVETGIAEQNALGIATGISSEGGLPFYVNFAIFASGTVWTQLRQACYARANIKILATHPGMDGGFDGASHHANEDLALVRALPNMVVLVPSCPNELEDALEFACQHEGPVYIRCSRDTVPNLKGTETLTAGKSMICADEGYDYALVFEGSAATLARTAFDAAHKRGGRGMLINIASIKPLDAELLVWLAAHVGRIVTVENHSVVGGLYSAVAEQLAGLLGTAPIYAIGVPDCFTESGTSADVKAKYGLTVDNVLKKLGV